VRAPSIAHGVVSFIWALGLGFLIWVFLLAIGIEGATAFIIGAVAGFGIFLYVRIFGEEEPRQRVSQRERGR
jgi:hypothetical protein